MTTENHALSQAIAQANSIVEMVGALNVDYDRLEELRDELASLEDDVCESHANHAEFAHQDAVKALTEWRAEYAEELKELEEQASGWVSLDAVQTDIQNDPLDIKVRADWSNPGEQASASEFQILLCTGGPAVRIMGELDEHMQPCRAWLEYQDWGTPWAHAVGVIEQDVLLQYCQQFYFGE